MVPRSRNATTNLCGSASGLRVALHVRGQETTKGWSLSVHATLQLGYY